MTSYCLQMNLVVSVVNVLEFVLRCTDCTAVQMSPIFVSLKGLFRVKSLLISGVSQE